MKQYLACCVLSFLSIQTVAIAQTPNIPPEQLSKNTRNSENSITFCVRADYLLKDKDIEIINLITSTILVEANIREYTTMFEQKPLDYQLNIEYDDLFGMLKNECDVITGLSMVYDETAPWLSYTAPVYDTQYVLVANEAAPNSLSQLDSDHRIGVRLGSAADLKLNVYLRSLSTPNKAKIAQYNDNILLLSKLKANEITQAYIWEPAILAYKIENPELKLFTIDSAPLQIPKKSFSFALLADDRALLAEIDGAITYLKSTQQLQDFLP